MTFVIGRQDDGTYVLRFETQNLRAEAAITREEMQTMVRLLTTELARSA